MCARRQTSTLLDASRAESVVVLEVVWVLALFERFYGAVASALSLFLDVNGLVVHARCNLA